MSNMSQPQRAIVYPLIVEQQGGEYCVICDRTKLNLMEDGHKPEFCIDVDDNSHDHTRANLRQMQLLCHSCNTKKNHPSLLEPFTRTASPEMIMGKQYENDFRRWVQGKFMENENLGLAYSYLLGSGSEKVDCSPETIKRYLLKMTSEEGMYEWFNKFGSESLLVLKTQYKNK